MLNKIRLSGSKIWKSVIVTKR